MFDEPFGSGEHCPEHKGNGMPTEWDRFKFEIGEANSSELTTVQHVVHVPFARRIVEDRRIKAGLVYDASRLNKSRISVAWVSANTWTLGSIYGTVEFQFAWADLVAGQKIYWVEAMTDYRPNAYRMLLSKRDLPTGLITPYDPAKDEGPLRLQDGKYYWNGAYTSEFMIEDDLSLDRCTGLGFVLHNQLYCRPFGNGCEDRQKQPQPQQTGGRMLSFVLGNRPHVLDKHLKPPGVDPLTLDTAYRGLESSLSGQLQFTGAISADHECQAIVRGSLALNGADQVYQARKLLALISSKDNFTKALKTIVRSHFGDPTWEPNDDF
jgi:hypothetical protein